jgi:hypothetical protein
MTVITPVYVKGLRVVSLGHPKPHLGLAGLLVTDFSLSNQSANLHFISISCHHPSHTQTQSLRAIVERTWYLP